MFRLRSFLVLVVAAMAALAGPPPARSRLSFIEHDRQLVGRGPMFVTTGRFDPDAPAGVAVASFWVDQITVFPLPDGVSLGARSSLDAGRNLRGIVSFDVDGDGTDDLLVADETGGSRDAQLLVFLRTAGGFHGPDAHPIQTSVVTTLRRGNFDGDATADLATANGRRGTVSVLYGTPTGFAPVANIFVAGSVTDVAAIDLDGDGADDLAILSERERSLSAITVLRSERAGFTALGPPTLLDLAGLRLVSGRFDDDDARDLAVVAAGPTPTDYRTRVLLTRRSHLGSDRERFVIEEQTFACPADLRGAATRCRLHDLIAADFDADGLDDVALSMVSPSLVAVLPRGPRALGTPVLIPLSGSPRGIAAGDVTGDGFADLVITEFDTNMITVMRNVPSPKKENGESCEQGSDCSSAHCVHATCCEHSSCSFGERCDITGRLGHCARRLLLGALCGRSTDCQSGICSAEQGGICVPGSGGDRCPGDCNEDGVVTVNEVVMLLQIALGAAGVETCPAADGTGDGLVTVDEIVRAVDAALDGC